MWGGDKKEMENREKKTPSCLFSHQDCKGQLREEDAEDQLT